jgi:erythromycin esterase
VSSVQLTVTQLAVRGDDARAQATYTFAGTYSSNKIATPFRGVRDVRDDWTLTAGGWKLRSRTVHDEISYVGGKLVEDNREQIAPTQAAIAELRRRAVVIRTLALDADPDQFAAIGKAIGNARIVGMGEGTHGTSEFFALKNRLFKYLVERKGFTIFAMEAYWGAGLNVDRYIKGGRDTARQAVASLGFWTWNTPEVVDLVQWMHDYNAAPGKHPILSFVGIDMQDPMGAIGYLAAYLHTHDTTEAGVAREALACSADAVANPDAKPPSECRQRVTALEQQLTALNNVPDVAMARQAATNILQYLDYAGQPQDAEVTIRDREMAANVEWVAAQYPDAKIAVWAHNGHVGTTPELSYRPMGSYLRQAFGSTYYVIGQTFGSGTVRAFVSGEGLQPVRVPLNSGDTTVELFAPLNAVGFIDVRRLPAKSALKAFFATQHGVSEIGSMMDKAHPGGGMPMVVPKSFDGLVYMPTSTASVSAVDARHMKREIHENGADWTIFGLEFDDVTVSTNPMGATLTNNDALNVSSSFLTRRFDAKPYVGKHITMTGEVRADNLLGYVLPFTQVTASDASALSALRGKVIEIPKGGGWVPFTQTVEVPENASFVDAGFMAEGFGSVEVRNLRIAASP